MPGVLCPSCGRGAPEDAVSCPSCGELLPVSERGEAFPMAAELAQALGPDYRVESLLGSGGYAHVFRVHDERLDRHLAAKVLLPDFAASSELAERFRREARTAARLTHPSIVPIYFQGGATDPPFYIMPLVQGET